MGILTTTIVFGETNGFSLYNDYKKFVYFVGYVVVEVQSGIGIEKTTIAKNRNSRIQRSLSLLSFVVNPSEVKQLKNQQRERTIYMEYI
ncbi:transposase [Polaribacter litorisediminis]|nr:transposase [Polaribacter litorisediminis]UAM96809.1 transposase [Polaribacter litorisediminis]